MLKAQHPIFEVGRPGVVLRNALTKLHERVEGLLVPPLEGHNVLHQSALRREAAQEEFQHEAVAGRLDSRGFGEPLGQLPDSGGSWRVLLAHTLSSVRSRHGRDQSLCGQSFKGWIDLPVALGPEEVQRIAQMLSDFVPGHRHGREHAKNGVLSCIAVRHVLKIYHHQP